VRVGEVFVAGAEKAVRFQGPLGHREHLQLVSSVDIALDSSPYSGQTNTCECLWMGVPVVTLAGQRFSSRVTTSILQQVGLGEWIAESPAGYVTLAERYANDSQRLAELRMSLRDRMRRSPLMDSRRAGREFAAACRTAWRQWCAGA
jgi:predicted O-linked N-acetylglucosamine transferase (SPINDLY family)